MTSRSSNSTLVLDRQLSNLHNDIKILVPYLDDPEVSDIMINPDGKLFFRKPLRGRFNSNIVVPQEVTRRILNAVAHMIGKTIDADNPRLAAVIPEYECRLHGLVPPITLGPSLCIRKPLQSVPSLIDYVNSGRMAGAHYDAILDAIINHSNIMIGGGTGTGKTTLLNSILNEIHIQFNNERFFIVEDTPEIKCIAPDVVPCVVPSNETVEAVRDALRENPDRIIFGELRYGDTALEFIKALNTGHPGGCATLHCDSSLRLLPRLMDLIAESVRGVVQPSFLSETINICIYLENVPGIGPKITDVLMVNKETHGGKYSYTAIPS